MRDRVKRDLSRLIGPLEDQANFQYGFNTDYLRDVGAYWLKDYDWAVQEKKLNQLNHFRTEIDGIDLHFIHAKPKDARGKKVVPILMVHGWPGTSF